MTAFHQSLPSLFVVILSAAHANETPAPTCESLTIRFGQRPVRRALEYSERRQSELSLRSMVSDNFSGVHVGQSVLAHHDDFGWQPATIVALLSHDHVLVEGRAGEKDFLFNKYIWYLREALDGPSWYDAFFLRKPRPTIPRDRIKHWVSHTRPQVNYPWNLDRTYSPDNYQSYDKEFVSLLKRTTIASVMFDRKYAGRSTHVLDLFGGAIFTADLENFDSLTGMRLELRAPNSKTKRDVVVGDATAARTWRELELNMRRRAIPSFDLVIFRPVAGIDYLFQASDDPSPVPELLGARTIFRMLGWAYRKLAPQGIILANFDHRLPNSLRDEYLERWRAIGADVEIADGTIKIVKPN